MPVAALVRGCAHRLGSAFLVLCCVLPAAAEETPSAADIMRTTGWSQGLCVRLDTTDGSLEAALTNNGRMLVHGLTTDGAAADQARQTITDARLYGLASIEKRSALTTLPYADNLVNLLIADVDSLGAGAPASTEIMRVLCPNGIAYLKRNGVWGKLLKPRPATLDDWTHFDCNAEGNGVSHDRAVKPPTLPQWWCDIQTIPTDGNPAAYTNFSSIRTAGNQLFFEYVRSGAQFYNGRDAFNGLRLWDVANTTPTARKDWQFVSAKGRLYAYLAKGGPLVALEAKTGRTLLTYEQGGRLPADLTQTALRCCDGLLVQTVGNTLYVLDAATGALKWTYTEATPGYILLAPVASAKDNKLFVAATDPVLAGSARWPVAKAHAVLGFELSTGKPLFRNVEVEGHYIGQLIYSGADDALAIFAANAISGGNNDSSWIACIRVSDAKLLWGYSVTRAYNRFAYNLLVRNGTMYYCDAWRIYAVNMKTGTETVVYNDNGYNQRCNRFSATDNYFIMGLVTYVDRSFAATLQGITRSGCAQGTFPANGMVHFTPNACRCITQLRGHLALSSETLAAPIPNDQRLETGVGVRAAALPAATQPADGEDLYPEYAPPAPHRAAAVREPRQPRGGTVAAQVVPSGPIPLDWAREADAPALELSSSLIDGSRYVGVVQEHRVERRDAEGNVLWRFFAAGRIATTPVLQGGLCYFGSSDGWVYCLNTADGSVAWRFLAARYDRRAVAHGQLESSWPVYQCAIASGKLYVGAGLHAELGGGMRTYVLDPTTGTILSAAASVAVPGARALRPQMPARR